MKVVQPEKIRLAFRRTNLENSPCVFGTAAENVLPKEYSITRLQRSNR